MNRFQRSKSAARKEFYAGCRFASTRQAEARATFPESLGPLDHGDLIARACRVTPDSSSPNGFTIKTRKPIAPIARWTQREAENIVAADMKALARKKRVHIPTDPREDGYKEAIALRILQVVAQNRIADHGSVTA